MTPAQATLGIVLICALAGGVGVGPSIASTDPPAPRSARFGGAAAGGGTVEVAGEARETRPATASAGDVIKESSYRLKCRLGAEPIIAATASCEPAKCLTWDGRDGERKAELIRNLDAVTREPVSDWKEIGTACIAERAAPRVSLDELVRREFKAMKLPGLEVRTFPVGGTLVNLPTTFSVERPEKDHELGRILGHRVTVVIRPVSYRWEFGDGASETTKPAHAQHTFAEPATVRASVTTEYRARYRVDGGSAREIPGTVSVEGPATELTVRQARSELVAGPR